MRSKRIRWAPVAAAALLILVAVGCKKKVEADLVIASPHKKKIEVEFERAFRAWHKAKFGTDVTFEWRDIGGSTTVTRYIVEQYKRSDSSGIDLYFGGGGPDHMSLTRKGITVAVELPEEIRSALPEKIGGVRQYDPQGRWHGAAVSAFGILYNAKLLGEEGLKIPQNWDDLARPEMFGRVSAADATQSGSARAAYEMIIQSEGDWPAGWAKLLTIFANCESYTSGASDIITRVANGQVLAGAAIDFYAYDQIATSGSSVGFILVEGTTAFTPDPISMLKGAPHPEMAKRFIEFVLSEQGQALWCLPPGAPGGPANKALFRQPVRQDIYVKYKGKMLAPLVDPFVHSSSFVYNGEAAEVRIRWLLGPLMKAAALDSHDQLTKAWKAIIDAGKPADLMKDFTDLPGNLADEATALATAKLLDDPKQAEFITSKWQRFFRAKYESIAKRAGR